MIVKQKRISRRQGESQRTRGERRGGASCREGGRFSERASFINHDSWATPNHPPSSPSSSPIVLLSSRISLPPYLPRRILVLHAKAPSPRHSSSTAFTQPSHRVSAFPVPFLRPPTPVRSWSSPRATTRPPAPSRRSNSPRTVYRQLTPYPTGRRETLGGGEGFCRP